MFPLLIIAILIIIKLFTEPCRGGSVIKGGDETEKVLTVNVGEPNPQSFEDEKYTFNYLSNDRFIGKNMEEKGYLFEKYTIIEAIRALEFKQGVVLDVGANIGTFAVPVSRARRVIAFEPQNIIYPLLVSNITNNKADVVANKKCAGDKKGYVRMQTAKDLKNNEKEYDKVNGLTNYGGIQIADLENGDTEMIVLDDFIEESVALIKVDVEGAEPMVFRGALKIIKKYKPFIIFEENDKKLNTEDFDIEKYCYDCGYRCVIININTHNKMLVPDEDYIAKYYKNTVSIHNKTGLKEYIFKKPVYKTEEYKSNKSNKPNWRK